MDSNPLATQAVGEPLPATSRSSASRFWLWGVLIFIVLFTAGIRFRLRDVPLERDEGEYAYAGQLILQGIPPYALAYNMKFPGTYCAYALIMAVFGQTPAGIHLGFILINAAGIILVYLLSAGLAGRGAGLAAAAIYACLSLSQALLGMAAHATHFVIVPALGGLLLLLRGRESCANGWKFFSGLLLGLAVLMKQPGAFFALFAIGWLVWIQPRPIQWPRLLRDMGVFAAGLLTPVILTGLWLWHAGVFGKFWFWTIDYAREYATENPGAKFTWHRLLDRTPGVIDLLFCAAVPGLVLLWRKADRSVAAFATGLFVFSAAAVFPGFNFWPHYFILWLPAGALLGGVVVASACRFFQQRQRPLLPALPAVMLAGLLACEFVHERALFFQAAPIEACRLIYGWNPFPESLQIGEYLNTHAGKNARIAVLGSEPQIYFFSHRHSATGYIYTYGLMESQPYAERMQREMIAEIEAAKPEYVVWVEIATSWAIRPNASPFIFDWADKYVNTLYQRVGVVDIYTNERTDVRWDGEAGRLPPQSPTYLSVFRRKDTNP